MEEGVWKNEDLKKCIWQYATYYKKATDFVDDKYVFLKSNPEIPMVIVKINKRSNTVRTMWLVGEDHYEYYDWKPEMILPYHMAGLIKHRTYNVVFSLN